MGFCTFYGWNGSLCSFCDWVSFAPWCDCEICSCCIWMCIVHSPLCEQLTIDWHSGSFQFGAIMGSAAVNILDMSLCEHGCSFLWIYIFRQGISDEYILYY